jgi:hypothetical protein
MKTLLSFVAVTMFIVASSFTIDVQQNLNQHSTQTTAGCFSSFKAHRQAKGTAMTWSVCTSDVVGFVVERSYDGEFFEDAASMNYDGNSSYKFSDKDVYPGMLYYRIKAVKTDASTEYSAVETVHIVQKH